MPKPPVLYEAMYVMEPEATAEQISAIEDTLRQTAEAKGAQVESFQDFGTRRLAFPVKHFVEGIYRIMYFRGYGDAVDDVKHEIAMHEQVIRSTIVIANPKMLVAPKPPPEPAEAAVEETAEAVAEEPAEAAAEEPAEAAVEETAEAAAEEPAEAVAEETAEAAAEERAEAAAEEPAETAAEEPAEDAAEEPAEDAAEEPAEATKEPGEAPAATEGG